MSRAVKDGRIRRIVRGVFTADLRAAPAELVARTRWAIVARLIPDALIADRSAAGGGLPTAGRLTVVSNERKEDLVLPGLVVAPRPGPGPLADDLGWAAGLHISSDARTLVDNLAVSRGRSGKIARTLPRAELEDWVVRTSQRRPDDWLVNLRARALAICEELDVLNRRPQVEDIIGAVAGTRAARADAGRLLAARASRHEYDPDRAVRFDELAGVLAAIPADLDVPGELPALPDEQSTSLPFFEAYFSNFIEGTEFSVDEAEAIHPYDDGNGRVARAAMNAELTMVGQSRIVVPIVFRNEYQTALRSLSREGRCNLYVRTLAHAWRWTAGMPWQDRGAVDGYLNATNALIDSTDAERSGVRLHLP